MTTVEDYISTIQRSSDEGRENLGKTLKEYLNVEFLTYTPKQIAEKSKEVYGTIIDTAKGMLKGFYSIEGDTPKELDSWVLQATLGIDKNSLVDALESGSIDSNQIFNFIVGNGISAYTNNCVGEIERKLDQRNVEDLISYAWGEETLNYMVRTPSLAEVTQIIKQTITSGRDFVDIFTTQLGKYFKKKS